MEKEKLEALIEDEKEWRRYMVTRIDKCTDEITRVNIKVERMRTWQNVFRLIFVTSIASIGGYLKSKTGG